MNTKNTAGKAALILIIAIVIVAGISFLPLSKISNGKIKDFNLLGDIMKEYAVNDSSSPDLSAENIDPELLKSDSLSVKNTDTLSEAVLEPDSVAIVAPKPSKVGDLVVIEDYTPDNRGLSSLRRAIGLGSLARIAFVGDSYIEGDIFTQDLREKLQNAYGGQGVGFVNMHSDFPGFRRSVRQGGSGWKTFTALKKGNYEYMALSEQYAIPSGKALSTYTGSKTFPHALQWSRSSFLFISPDDAVVSYRTDSKGEWTEHNVTGDSVVQSLSVDCLTDNFEIKTSAPELIGLGVWLDGNTGIALDCMSSRGFSGVTLTKINSQLCRQMSAFIPYNLIILEFGINAMSAKQTDYHIYSNRMVNVISHVRACYPGADILLLGIGDRGEKHSTEIHSMKVAEAMVTAQRDAARRARCLFWDTREAMGGQDAIVEWTRSGLANKDYIHLTHKGGAVLADKLFNAMQQSLK